MSNQIKIYQVLFLIIAIQLTVALIPLLLLLEIRGCNIYASGTIAVVLFLFIARSYCKVGKELVKTREDLEGKGVADNAHPLGDEMADKQKILQAIKESVKPKDQRRIK